MLVAPPPGATDHDTRLTPVQELTSKCVIPEMRPGGNDSIEAQHGSARNTSAGVTGAAVTADKKAAGSALPCTSCAVATVTLYSKPAALAACRVLRCWAALS